MHGAVAKLRFEDFLFLQVCPAVFVEQRTLRECGNIFDQSFEGIICDERGDFADALQTFPDQIQVLRLPEISRKGENRRRIELEDLITTSGSTSAAFHFPKDAAYLPIPLGELQQREKFGWFLRMSEEQILESDMVISHLFKRAL